MPQRQPSPKLTPKRAAKIKWLWDNTTLNQAQISALLGSMNQGRISEVVNGHRFSEVQPEEIKEWNA